MDNFEFEPLLDSRNNRLTVFPINKLATNIWKLYKEQIDSFWRPEEIDFTEDSDAFKELSKEEQYFIKNILAFFASSDGIVNLNLREKFLNEIQMTEVVIAYGYQMMMENIHGEVYSLMLQNIIENESEREKLFKAVHEINSIKLMADWALNWSNSKTSLAHRIVAFAAVEGIFFSGSFASIYWLRQKKVGCKKMMKGLFESNRFIARDEGIHCKFACEVYKLIVNKLPQSEIYKIISEAVNISILFMNEAITCDMIGMNQSLMSQYIKYTGDYLLDLLGYKKKYHVENPFQFMESISLMNKSNFFELRPSEYHTGFNENNKNSKFVFVEDF